MGQNIFEISSEYLEILNRIEENDGELTEEDLEALKVTRETLDNKFQNYAYIILSKKADSKTIDEEVKRLGALKKTNDNLVKKLSGIVIDTMRALNLTGASGNFSYKLPKHTLFTRDTEAVELYCEEPGKLTYPESAEKYGDMLEYGFGVNFSKEQVDVMVNALIDAGLYTGVIVKPTISKTRFKEVNNLLINMSDESAVELAEQLSLSYGDSARQVAFSNTDGSEAAWEKITMEIPLTAKEAIAERFFTLGGFVTNTSLNIR